MFHFDNFKATNELLDIAAEQNFDSYTDLFKTAKFYEYAVRFEGLIIAINCIVIVKFFRINPTINFFMHTIRSSLHIFLVLGVAFCLLFLAYAIIANQIWGNYIYEFKDIPNSILYIISVFELRIGDQRAEMYDLFSFGYEKFFGFVLIIMIIFSVLSFTITLAVVLKAYDKELMLFEQSNLLNKDKPHYLVRWLKAAYFHKVMPCFFRSKRKNAYKTDEADHAGVNMIKSINKKRLVNE